MSVLLKHALNWSIIQPFLIYGFFMYLIYQLTRKFVAFQKLSKMINKIPGPAVSLNPLGHVYLFKPSEGQDLITRFYDAGRGLVKMYDTHSLFRVWLGPTPVIMFIKADAAEKIFSSNLHIEKATEYGFLEPWLGTGLLTSSGKKWFQRRKMLTPAFHFNVLETFLPAMNEQSNVLLEKIAKQVEESKTNSAVIDVVDYLTYAALDVICETAMGVKMGSQSNPNSDFVMATHRVGSKVIKRILSPWLWNNFIYYNLTAGGRQDKADLEFVHNFTSKVIKERKKEALEQRNRLEVENNNQKEDTFSRRRLAFLDILVEQHLTNPETLSELDIRDEVDTFMFEGHDTTAMSMTWTLFFLGHHPKFQERVQQEIDNIWERDQVDDCKQLRTSQLREMKFLEACIKEALRLFPSVPLAARVAATDIPHENYIIPKGVTMFLCIQMMHLDAKFFPNPNAFIPDRFIKGSGAFSKNPFSYVPFSAGPRNCIGQKFAMQEEKVFLATVLRHYSLQSVKQLDQLLIHPELVMRPKEPINIRFTRRQLSCSEP